MCSICSSTALTVSRSVRDEESEKDSRRRRRSVGSLSMAIDPDDGNVSSTSNVLQATIVNVELTLEKERKKKQSHATCGDLIFVGNNT